MTEEEKEAIKYLEFLSNEKCECEACQHAKKEYKTISNLINKQQKEIEELQKDKKVLIKNYDKVLGTFICKDKIRELIKKCNDYLKEEPMNIEKIEINAKISILQELLEEN